ncbi:hypothetical protein M514_08538 [Trichuris suis]|uniref:Uncharacterized protein n=1 Tax=Trichuris suis TaxID=68888 RepID=A0A085M043_9BILA|nr:hypothetical protein M513_08538 [Trichuris suis]KFD67684.1 hypothetical protein M514_08538 [Trichuris suis]
MDSGRNEYIRTPFCPVVSTLREQHRFDRLDSGKSFQVFADEYDTYPTRSDPDRGQFVLLFMSTAMSP